MKLNNMLKEFSAADEAELNLKRTKERQFRMQVTGIPKMVDMGADECKLLCDIAQVTYEDGYEKRVLKYITTTENPDRYGDIVRAAGAQFDNYRRNAVIQFAHDYSNPPVGNTIQISIDSKAKNVPALGLFVDERVDPTGRADLIFRFAQSGFMKACSIGFLPVETYRPQSSEERVAMGLGEWGLEYRLWDFMEWSPCPIPANPNALQESLKGAKNLKSLFGKKDIDLMGKFRLFENPNSLDLFIEHLEGRTNKSYSFFSPVRLKEAGKDQQGEEEEGVKKPKPKVGTEDGSSGDQSEQTACIKVACPKCDAMQSIHGKTGKPIKDPESEKPNEEDNTQGNDDDEAAEAKGVVGKSNHKKFELKCAEEKCGHEFTVYPKGKSISVKCPACEKTFQHNMAPTKEKIHDVACPKCEKEMKVDIEKCHKSVHECERELCMHEFVHNHASAKCADDPEASEGKAVKGGKFPEGAFAKCTKCGNHHKLAGKPAVGVAPVSSDHSDSDDGESQAQAEKSFKKRKKALESNPALVKFVADLTDDLKLEYASIIQYIQHAAMVEGPEYSPAIPMLDEHADEEHEHAEELAAAIELLGGVVTVEVGKIYTDEDSEEMLEQDAETEKLMVKRYTERIKQAEELELLDVAHTLSKILKEESEHLHEVITVLGIEESEVEDISESEISPAAPVAASVKPVTEKTIENSRNELAGELDKTFKAMARELKATLSGFAEELRAASGKKRSPFAPENIKLFDKVEL